MPDFDVEGLIAKWEEFFDEYQYIPKIIGIANSYPEKRSLYVEFQDLDRYDTDMAMHFLRSPTKSISTAEDAIKRLIPLGQDDVSIHLRMRNLPKDARVAVRDLRSKHLGKYISTEGLVRKATEVRPRLTEAIFQCVRCGTFIKEPQEERGMREPLECYEDQGGCKRASTSTKFKLVSEESVFLDTQKIEIQERPEGLRGGAEPQRLVAYVADDITGQIAPGDRIILNGTLRSVQRTIQRTRSTLFDIHTDVNSVEAEQKVFEEIDITEQDVKDIKEAGEDPDILRNITASISPSIYGMTMEKEALVLQLFGGVAKEMPDGTRIRGDIHILMVGDPGTGKSQALTYISALAPRGVYATGKSATAAGLTAAAVRDEFGEGRWTLEAGALVLADMGIVCIDEIEKMNPQDRSAIHLGMEQQFITISKAGIQATLQCRCAVLAAANPKFGRFDESKYIYEQIELPPTLLSRFDVIFTILDRPEAVKDRDMAEHILKGHLVGEVEKRREEGEEIEAEVEFTDAYLPHFEPAFLRKYIAYAKRIYPVMTEEAMDVLRDYYLTIRKQGEVEGAAVPITPRQLESFVRLAEASARSRLSDVVSTDDADRAVRIVDYWLRKVTGEEGRFDIDIIATGTSRSQREQIIILRDVIQELAGDEGSATLEDIVSLAEERGLPPTRVESWLNRWKEEGEIYSPRKNRFKLVTRR
ncbi:MAG: minichromosome maintenance protein MCM [Methanobacteriota archaeon]|nr:MAG: minichromosome maintenance protein MCM [Euryarchaeota archaeon]